MKVNVLIVEDNQTKRTEIEKTVVTLLNAEVLGVSTVRQAYKSIELKPWDLIILDMTFQVTPEAGNDSAKEALAGIEILQFMGRRRIDTPVIVATQHTSFSNIEVPDINSIAELDQLLRDLFPENYRTTVEVDLSEEGWKTELQKQIIAALKR